MSVEEPDSVHRLERRSAAMWNIRIDVALGRVAAALRERGTECIVLKGPALRGFYPDEVPRRYMDGDLWVAPASVAAAESVLDELGFRPKVDERGLPDWWIEHASSWQQRTGGAAIDLHRRLQGVTVSAETAWAMMRAETEMFEVGGEQALRLSPAAAAVYLALHAGHHGVAHPSAVEHVGRAVGALHEADWRRAVALASELGATDLFAAGLRLSPEGGALADLLSLPFPKSAAVHLQAATPPPVARGFDQLSRANWGERLAIVMRKLFPPPGFIRYWWRPAARSPWLLAVGYVYRPIWLVLRAPTGWLAWRRARTTAADVVEERGRDQRPRSSSSSP